ncbi:MAG: ABC transporter ATP-binding protein [Lachnospiraceae bacterium]|nr:ABC transporter ATP-binding protein [Lachnospira sp.]MBR6697984.1 ABC transporter ATP-binding protein [Lachnospiraceae bacterium]
MEILEAKDISRTYVNGKVETRALKQCDVTIKKGEFVAIIGKSGSGKSTLLRILAGMDKPDSGEVMIDGENINKFKDRQLAKFRRNKIGYVYQDYSLLPEFTAYENIVMATLLDGKKPDKERVYAILNDLEIDHCKNKYPHQMSGGEQQRVAIARALYTEPAIIFADEPTGNLDVASAKGVAKILTMASEKYNQTIVMVTHDKQMSEYADRIISIVDGVISE